ncbi:MAG: TRAP transporter large permease [Alphaproteobacteria bacterium]
MSGLELGLAGFGVLLALLALRIPIGVAMLAVGIVGYGLALGELPLLAYLKTEPYWRFANFDLSVVPLFVLMGQFAARAGLSQALFRAANAYLGHLRGGIAMAAIGACAGFGTIAGSSLATAATMGQVALPELARYRYSGALATGTLAAGGTLGILIPPSVVLIIFAIIAEANIATMFLAAFVPGVLAALGYIAAIAVVVRLDPEAGPAGERAGAAERRRALVEIWPVVVIFGVVMGGIYGGIFTPTEGAGVGATATGALALARGMSRTDFLAALLETATTTGMIFLILLGAAVFNAFLGATRMPNAAADWFAASGLSPYAVLLGIIVLYLILGCVMDSLSMIILTVPIFWPIVAGLDYGMPAEDTKLWFGIIALIVVEVGLITPPVGLNVFIINRLAPHVPMMETFRGVVPFLASDVLRVAVIVAAPPLTLLLPRWVN